MSQDKTEQQPEIRLKKTDNYRDTYANTVQVRVSLWDFHLVFGTMGERTADTVELESFQGVYLSPQQAKALWNILGSNLIEYEQTFGKLSLEPHPPAAGGPVN